MRAYIYKDNELQKIEFLNNNNKLSTKGKIRLKRIFACLTKLSKKNYSKYYVEVKMN